MGKTYCRYHMITYRYSRLSSIVKFNRFVKLTVLFLAVVTLTSPGKIIIKFSINQRVDFYEPCILISWATHYLRPRTHGNVFLRFCIVSSNELVVLDSLENSKQYENAGKRFRVYGPNIVTPFSLILNFQNGGKTRVLFFVFFV